MAGIMLGIPEGFMDSVSFPSSLVWNLDVWSLPVGSIHVTYLFVAYMFEAYLYCKQLSQVSVQVMYDESTLTVEAYNQLLMETRCVSSKVMEEIAGLRATLTARKKQASAAARSSASSAMEF